MSKKDLQNYLNNCIISITLSIRFRDFKLSRFTRKKMFHGSHLTLDIKNGMSDSQRYPVGNLYLSNNLNNIVVFAA